MPPICLHLGIAKEAAERLRHPVVDQNLGRYLLGATTPDIRIITGGSREETHFFDLESDLEESSVRPFFKAHPHLADPAKLGQATRAFVAGYLSHLVTDELWIVEIYRPFFSKSSPLGEDAEANVLDRALQFELDRRERLDHKKMGEIEALLRDSDSGVDIGFIDALTLREWREFVCIAALRAPSWLRFRFYAERYLLPEQKVNPEQLDLLLVSVPKMLKKVFQYVAPERIGMFREKAINDSVKVAGEYLD